MGYQAVIFDLDGTLLDTLADLAGAMNQVLQGRGLPTHPAAAYKYFVGDGMVNLARRALPIAAPTEELVSQVAEALRLEYGRRWQQLTHPYPAIPELLQTLHQRGIKLGVLTNKPDNFAQDMVRAFFPEITFGAVVGAKPSLPLKPDPAGALALAWELTVPPRDIILVGDSGNDMQTARAAGMYGAGALWGFRTATELQDAGAKVLLAKPADLLTIIG